MTDISAGLTASVKTRLVKWDGEPPPDADPIGHPQCIAVIEIEDDSITTIYQRKDP